MYHRYMIPGSQVSHETIFFYPNDFVMFASSQEPKS